jgi:putative flippase GtrA
MENIKTIPDHLRGFLDIFYPIVKKLMSKTTYYYAVCGASNMVLSWVLFYLFYNYLFQQQKWTIPLINMAVNAYTISAAICFVISFSIGFTLLKYVVFTASEIKGRIQLFRYGISALISFVTSYAILRLLIEVFGIYASISNVIASVIVAIISYLIQRNFTFR